jgi:tryptophan-rich sensory protein
MTQDSHVADFEGVSPRRSKIFVLGIFLLLSYATAAVASSVGDLGNTSWYDRPAFQPPGWVFAVVWSTLYTLIGITGWLVWFSPPGRWRAWGLLAWAIQLPINAAWPWVFEGLRLPGWALVHLVLLWLVVAFTVVAFFKVSRLAGLLLLPYLLWCSFAIALNAAVLPTAR